jgi:hypothetical protein
MFCRFCGGNLEGGANFCTACGARTDFVGAKAAPAPPPSPPPRRRSGFWLYAVAAFFFLLFVIALLNNGKPGDTTTVEGGTTTVKPPSNTSETPGPDHHKVGESFAVGYWSYRCNGVRWQRSIGSEYSRQYPDAKFLVVDLSVRNNDTSASVLAPLKLVDAEGREYDESSKGIFLDNSFGMLKSLNPGVTSRGYIAFDVPTGNYALKVSGGFTSGKNELIDLQ